MQELSANTFHQARSFCWGDSPTEFLLVVMQLALRSGTALEPSALPHLALNINPTGSWASGDIFFPPWLNTLRIKAVQPPLRHK